MTNTEQLALLREINQQATGLSEECRLGLRKLIATLAGKQRLSPQQHGFLDALRRHNQYYEGCGWSWGSHAQSARLAESLVKLGLATKVGYARQGKVVDAYEYVEVDRV